jgi:hypothetical protein
LAAVDVSLTLISQSDMLLHLVGDFARGLGCSLDAAAAGQLRIELPDTGDGLLELLDYVALSAAKAGVDVAEPLCRLAYHRGEALARVTIDLRITAFNLTTLRPGAEATGHESP